MSKVVNIEVAPGELLDKISILEIKKERMEDTKKLKNVRKELRTLKRARDVSIGKKKDINALYDELKSINEQLWDIEDNIRACEWRNEFGPEFIELARAVYRTNDKRAAVKRKINIALDAEFLEEKSYQEY